MFRRQRPLRSHCAAFTLVELAIVLVIIGLIIGGVLTAQQITNNARITSVIQGLKAIQAAVQSYNQNYGALPGDDKDATSRFTGKNVPGNGDGLNIIGTGSSYNNADEGSFNSAAGESPLFWSHLRAAGMIKGDGSQAKPMGNPFGGIYGVQDGALGAKGFARGVNVVCADHIPGNAAQAVDQQLDDGLAGSGSIRGGTDIGAVADNYDGNGQYVLCTPLQ